jgi:membrane associated rhomboid family serine protease
VRKPYVTVTLIVVNTLVFLYAVSLGIRGFRLFTIQYGFIPYELVSGVELTPELSSSIYLTPFTSMFMHGGWMHLIGNMLFLWIYGNNVEDYFGPVKFLLFYLMSGFAAIGLYTLFGPNSQVPLVGASGAIAGVMGAYMVLHPRARITVLFIFFFIQFLVLPAKVVLGIWFIYQLLMSLTGSASGGGVAWMAHVGGFVFGWAVLRMLTRGRRRRGSVTDGQRIYRVYWD